MFFNSDESDQDKGKSEDQQQISTAQGAVAAVRSASETVDEQLADIDERTSEEAKDMDTVVEEVSSLTSTIEEVAEYADDVAGRSDSAARDVDEGLEAARQALEVMEGVSETGSRLAKDIGELEDRLTEVTSVLNGIRDLADQTDLLALNARIEAARADDNSTGFAVVANEIKGLANQSQKQASKVEAILEEVRDATSTTINRLREAVDQVENGAEQVQKTMRNLDDVSESVDDTARDVREVSDATDDQAEVSESVAEHCRKAADRVQKIQRDVNTIRQARAEQTNMLREIEDSLRSIASSDLDEQERIAFGRSDLDASTDGGVVVGGRSILLHEGEDQSALVKALAGLISRALSQGYSVSLTPPPGLTRSVLEKEGFGREGQRTVREALDQDRLFLLDAFNDWEEQHNVFDLSQSSLSHANRMTDRRRDQPLLVIGNIRGEIEVLGEKTAREARYENDGGFLTARDTVLNVIDTAFVDESFASFYVGAADQVIEL